ncbi:MAG: N-acetylmuramic acid 6-phosphate etherase [Clostridia bacterium]|nr:N-acetylmuramic acid 6-phosphate etherase [Clostridia bacterium]
MIIPKTERRNPKSTHLDLMSTEEMARLVIEANYDAVRAVAAASADIALAIDAITRSFDNGGRLFYVGAGTSGRLGVLDAAECPPTFGVHSDVVQGIIAGGNDRMFNAGENAEDKYDDGCEEIIRRNVDKGDVVVGISAAGNAAFVVGALEEAKKRGAVTVGISSNPDTKILKAADIQIFTDTGEEVLTGSTRLKAGTAQKIVLNTLTTCAMTKTGKVYENMMINLAPSNEKLKKRVIRIVTEILSCTENEAMGLLEKNGWNIRRSVDDFRNNHSEEDHANKKH